MKKICLVAAVAAIFLSTNAFADSVVENISGVASWDFFGDPDNETIHIDLGAPDGADITGIDWDVTITTVGASWFSESSFAFVDDTGAQLSPTYTPGAGDDFGGTGSYVGGGDADFKSEDGFVYIQFFEIDFDDNFDAVDSFYESGSTLTVNFNPQAIPEPASIALLSVLGIGLVSRRRR